METISFITFHPFSKHLQKQPNAGEKLWENRQLRLQACNLASIDSALCIPHGHAHMRAETSKQPPKIASTHADYRKSEIIAYQISLSRVWRSSHSQRGRRGELITYQEKWTANELEKNERDCASQKAFKMTSKSNKNKLQMWISLKTDIVYRRYSTRTRPHVTRARICLERV